jgi:hypothetical protein
MPETIEMRARIESLDGLANVSQYFRNVELSKLPQKDLIHLLTRMAEINARSHMDAYVALVRDELNQRVMNRQHMFTNTLAIIALVLSIATSARQWIKQESIPAPQPATCIEPSKEETPKK